MTHAIVIDRKSNPVRADIDFDIKHEVDTDLSYHFGGLWTVRMSQPGWYDAVTVDQSDCDHLQDIVRLHNSAVRERRAREFRERNERAHQRLREEMAAKAAVEKAAAEKRRAERAAMSAAKDEAARRLALLNTLSATVPSNSFSEGYAKALRDVLTA